MCRTRSRNHTLEIESSSSEEDYGVSVSKPDKKMAAGGKKILENESSSSSSEEDDGVPGFRAYLAEKNK